MESRGTEGDQQPAYEVGAPPPAPAYNVGGSPPGYHPPRPEYYPLPPAKQRRSVPLWATITTGAVAFVVGIGAGSGGKTSENTPTTAAAAAPVVTTVFITTQVPAPVAAAPPATTKPAAAPAATSKPAAATLAPAAPVATSKAAPPPTTIPGDGTFAVGTDIKPGIYKTSGPAPDAGYPNCYWERDKDLSGGFDSIIANNNSKGPTTVQIAATDKAFKTSGCADWTKVG